VTDSVQYRIRVENRFYRGEIGYRFTNPTGATLSRTYCHNAPPPELEKNVGGRWVVAFHPARLLCENIPPFRIAPRATYRGTLDFRAAQPGLAIYPHLEVDSIDGIYRLHWFLVVGAEPRAAGAATLEAISNEFQLAER